MPSLRCGQALRGRRSQETTSEELHHPSDPSTTRGTTWKPPPQIPQSSSTPFFPFPSIRELLFFFFNDVTLPTGDHASGHSTVKFL